MKTKLEILEETKNHYNSTNRGIGEFDAGCMYKTPAGNMCAVGRCMTEEAIEKFGDFGGAVLTLTRQLEYKSHVNYNPDGLDGLLKEEYHNHDKNFWQDLQTFHDCGDNWNANGLSKRGEEKYNALVKLYEDKA